MIKVQFKVSGETKKIMYDVDGWTLKECKEKVNVWVLEDYPTATEIEIIGALQGIP